MSLENAVVLLVSMVTFKRGELPESTNSYTPLTGIGRLGLRVI